MELRNTLAEAKAEMDAAAKAVRQRVKATHQASKPELPAEKKDESAASAPLAGESTPSLFAGQQNADATTETSEEEGRIQTP